MDFWILEQKWTATIIFGLMLFNNPLFSLEILVDGWIPPFLDILFIVTFLFLILFFILVIVDGVRFEAEDRSYLFYLPKIFLIGLLWISTIGVFSWREYNTVIDPALSFESDMSITVFEYALPIALVAYVIWLAVSATCAFSVIEKVNFLKRRLLFFLSLSIFIMLVIALGILFNVFLYMNNASEFLAFHSLVNLYVFTLAIVYMPNTSVDRAGLQKFESDGEGGFKEGSQSVELDDSLSLTL